MQEKAKKQFSLSLLIRIFLALLVVISIGICARSIMQYNELNREAEALENALKELSETRAELVEDLGSADELKRVLSDYQLYQELPQLTPRLHFLAAVFFCAYGDSSKSQFQNPSF